MASLDMAVRSAGAAPLSRTLFVRRWQACSAGTRHRPAVAAPKRRVVLPAERDTPPAPKPSRGSQLAEKNGPISATGSDGAPSSEPLRETDSSDAEAANGE
jgi:hypothetical protein